NSELTLHAIASQEHVTPGYVSRLLRLPTLAPDIITAIINGKNPPQLTAKKLMRLTPGYRSTGLNSGNCLASNNNETLALRGGPALSEGGPVSATVVCRFTLRKK